MLFVRYKFRHIEHNNTTLCTQFSNLLQFSNFPLSTSALVWHLSMTQQNAVVSNLYSANCSGAPSDIRISYTPGSFDQRMVIRVFIDHSLIFLPGEVQDQDFPRFAISRARDRRMLNSHPVITFIYSSHRSSPLHHHHQPILNTTNNVQSFAVNSRRVLRPRTEPRSYVESPDVLINGLDKPRTNGSLDYSSDSSEGEMPPLAPIKELSPSELKQRYSTTFNRRAVYVSRDYQCWQSLFD